MLSIREIEDAFLAALEPLRSEGVQTVEPYSETLTPGDMQALVRRMPAVFVVWAGTAVEPINQMDTYSVRVMVLVCDRNLRGHREATRGAGHARGVYHWLDRCRELLHRQRVLPGRPPVRLEHEGALSVETGDFVVYQQSYELKARLQP